MSDLFISYSSADRSRVERLVEALEAAISASDSAQGSGEHWSIWWDREILAGRRFGEVIELELAAARCVLVVWSEHSVASDWVLSEASKGLERGVLVPVRFDGSELPMPFDRVQTASLVDWTGDVDHPGFRKLVASIAETLGREVPEPAPSPAGFWERLRPQVRAALVALTAAAVAAAGWAGWRLLGPPRGMVRVAGGEFFMGSIAGEAISAFEDAAGRRPNRKVEVTEWEVDRHRVKLDAFYIDKREVTVAEFRDFQGPRYADFRWAAQQGGDDEPIVGVNWAEALEYCEGQGKSLPTEAQWEKAARGTDARIFPWGDLAPHDLRANFCDTRCAAAWADPRFDDGRGELAPVGSYPDGRSPYGAHDLAGNVGEWVRDVFDRDAYDDRPQVTSEPEVTKVPPSSGGELRVVRGGSYRSDLFELRSTHRASLAPGSRDPAVGFRCAKE